MSLGKELKVRAASCSLLLGMCLGTTALATAQNEAAPPPPPPPGDTVMLSLHGPGGGPFFHEELGEGHKIVTGAPMTAVIEMTHDTTLADGNNIHRQNQSTVYRDSQGRVRREVGFELMTPTTGATQGTMIVITDPVAGMRYILNPQNKTAHQMSLRPPKPPASAAAPDGEPPARPADANVTTTDLGTKTILGLQTTGTRVTRIIPEGQIGNAKPIEVVTERWVSTDLQFPMLTTHTDPMMGTMSSQVTSVTRGEPSASLFQVPSDYKVVAGKPGDMLYMRKP